MTFHLNQPIVQTPAEDFAEAMSALASGVVLVTCWIGDRPWGMTVTAFASVSADPPTVLVSLDGRGGQCARDRRETKLRSQLLASDQLAVARHGSAPGATSSSAAARMRGPATARAPVSTLALAHLDCEVIETVQVADHTVFFGQGSGRPGAPSGERRWCTTAAATGRWPSLFDTHTDRPKEASDASRVDSQHPSPARD